MEREATACTGRARIHDQPHSVIRKGELLVVFNVMEEIAKHSLQDIFVAGYSGCQCEICQNDILAIALNRLPPQYSSRQAGEAYIKARLFADQWKVDIIRELTKAAEIVSASKRHE